MKRLLVVTTHPIQYYAPIFQALSRRGISVKVIYFSDCSVRGGWDKDFKTSVAWDNDLLSGYDYEILYPDSSKPGFRNSWLPNAGQRIAKFAPDVIWLFGYSYLFSWQLWLMHFLKKYRLLYFSDSNFTLECIKKKRSAVSYFFKRCLLRGFFGTIDYCYCTSDKNYDYLRYYGARERTICRGPFAVDAELLLKSDDPGVRDRLDQFIRPDAIVFGWTGKFSPLKRGADFLLALRQLHDEGIRVQGIMIGAGNMEDEWKKLISAPQYDTLTIWPGFVNASAIGSYLKRCDVFVFTSDFDAYGLSVTEAVICGLPVVATACSGCVGNHAAAVPGKNAFAYPAGDVKALTDMMRQLAVNQSLRDQMAVQSKQIGANQTIEAAAQVIQHILQSS